MSQITDEIINKYRDYIYYRQTRRTGSPRLLRPGLDAKIFMR